MSYQPTGKQGSLFREIFYDLPFFIPARSKAFMEERAALWEKHVTMFAYIKHGKDSTSADWNSTRINFLIENLNIIDRKFAALLQFQGLLGIAVTVFVEALIHIIMNDRAMIVFLGLFAALWFIDTFICMRGVGRIRWGDLWMSEDTAHAEQECVRMLIRAVIGRTAIYRLAVLFTFLNGFALLLIIIGAGLGIL